MTEWFSVNGTVCGDFGLTLLGYDKKLFPAARGKYIKIPGRDGTIALREAMDDLEIVLRCRVNGETEREVLDNVNAASALMWGVFDLILWDEDPRRRTATVVSGTKISDFNDFCRADILLRVSPCSYGPPQTVNGPAVFIDGAAPNRGVFTMAAPGNGTYEISLTNGEGNISLLCPFRLGDEVRFDMSAGVALVNGLNYNRYLKLGSRFFAMNPGDINISCIAIAGASSYLVPFSYTYEPRWY